MGITRTHSPGCEGVRNAFPGASKRVLPLTPARGGAPRQPHAQPTPRQPRAGSNVSGGVHAPQLALEFGNLVAQPRRELELELLRGEQHLRGEV